MLNRITRISYFNQRNVSPVLASTLRLLDFNSTRRHTAIPSPSPSCTPPSHSLFGICCFYTCSHEHKFRPRVQVSDLWHCHSRKLKSPYVTKGGISIFRSYCSDKNVFLEPNNKGFYLQPVRQHQFWGPNGSFLGCKAQPWRTLTTHHHLMPR